MMPSVSKQRVAEKIYEIQKIQLLQLEHMRRKSRGNDDVRKIDSHEELVLVQS